MMRLSSTAVQAMALGARLAARTGLPLVLAGLSLACSQAAPSEEAGASGSLELTQLAGLPLIETWSNRTLGNVTITRPGVYRIEGTVTGNVTINPSRGQIVLEGVPGTNPVLQGIPRAGERRHVSHVSGFVGDGASVIVRNFELRNNVHNGMEFSGPGPRLVSGVRFTNYTRTIAGREVFGAGCVNAGQNSELHGLDLHTGDDAIKITEANSQAFDSRVTMYENGTAIQFGWDFQAQGNTHVAQNIEVFGSIATNANHDSPNTDNNPGRAVIGGSFKNDVKDVRLTGLKIHGNDYARVIKLVADGAVLSDVVIQGELVDGIRNHTDRAGRTWYAIALATKNGGAIRNLSIDLGPEAADPAYHSIVGDVDVKFVGQAAGGGDELACSQDADCAPDQFCGADVCKERRPRNATCSRNSQCTSGRCFNRSCR